MLFSVELKFSNFVILLFLTNLTFRIFITLLFLTNTHTHTHTHAIPCHNDFLAGKDFIKKHLNRHPSQLVYNTNLFDNNCNHCNMYLTNFNSFVGFAICSRIPSSEEWYNMENQSIDLEYKSVDCLLYDWRYFWRLFSSKLQL